MSAHGRALSPAMGLLLLASTSAAADLRPASECQQHKPSGDPRWWSFRMDVDGVRGKCWYPGKPGKPKTELHWARRPDAEERPRSAVQTPSEDPGALSLTCCWPLLEELPPAAPQQPTFTQRWNDLLSDMAMPVTRWRAPLKDQHRFGE